jgi:hypothetical protein
MKRFADLEGPDFFPTPRWATFALIENEKFDGEIWESACGDGAMSRVLKETGQSVRSSDLYERGFGEAGIDFLTPQSIRGQHRYQPTLQLCGRFCCQRHPACKT